VFILNDLIALKSLQNKLHYVFVAYVSVCLDPQTITNGNSASNGTHTQFTCNIGFVLVGECVLVCTNGVWDSTAPHCCELGKFIINTPCKYGTFCTKNVHVYFDLI